MNPLEVEFLDRNLFFSTMFSSMGVQTGGINSAIFSSYSLYQLFIFIHSSQNLAISLWWVCCIAIFPWLINSMYILLPIDSIFIF